MDRGFPMVSVFEWKHGNMGHLFLIRMKKQNYHHCCRFQEYVLTPKVDIDEEPDSCVKKYLAQILKAMHSHYSASWKIRNVLSQMVNETFPFVASTADRSDLMRLNLSVLSSPIFQNSEFSKEDIRDLLQIQMGCWDRLSWRKYRRSSGGSCPKMDARKCRVSGTAHSL